MSLLTNGLCLAVNGYTDWHARSRFLRTWNGKMNATADVKDDSARSSVETADAAASSSSTHTHVMATQSEVSDDDETSDTAAYVSPLGERVTVSTQLRQSHQELMRCTQSAWVQQAWENQSRQPLCDSGTMTQIGVKINTGHDVGDLPHNTHARLDALVDSICLKQGLPPLTVLRVASRNG
jgi:hypothetical protein